MGTYRQALTEGGGTYRKALAKDPRQSADYAKERKKAEELERIRVTGRVNKTTTDLVRGGPARENAWQAFIGAAGEPLPVMDELVGFAKGTGDYIASAFKGKSAPEAANKAQSTYLANKDVINEARDRRNRDRPVSSTVGGLLSGFAAAPVKGATVTAPAVAEGSKVVSFLKNNAKAAAAGGLFAGAYGFSDSEGAERFEDAGRAVPAGLLAGSLLHGAGTVAAPIIQKGAGVVKDAARVVTRKPTSPGVRPKATPEQAESAALAVEGLAMRKGLTPDRIAQTAADDFAGKPVTAAEIMGREGVGQLAATARRGGSTADDLEALLVQRQRGAPDRIMQDFADDLGVTPASAVGDVQGMVKEGRKAAAPLYDEAYAVGGVDDPRLDTLRERPSMRSAMSRARTIAAEEGLDPTELGFRTVQAPETRQARMLSHEGQWQTKRVETRNPGAFEDRAVQVENPTARTWDYVKRGLDDQLEAYRDPTSRRLNLDEMGRAKLNTLNEFRDVLRDVNPKYAQALDTSGDYLSLIDAMNTAKGKVMRGSVSDFGRAWASAKTPAAQNAFRAQIAQDVLDAANAGQLRGGKFTIPGAQQKLELAFGREGAQRFVSKMEAEARLAGTGARMMPGGGSPTYELAEAGAEAGGDMARIAGKFGRGQVWSGTLDALGTGASKLIAYHRTAGVPVEVRDEFGRLLQMSADEFAEWLSTRGATPKAQISGYLPSGAVGGQIAGRTSE